MSSVQVLPMVADFISKPRRMLIGSEWREASSGSGLRRPIRRRGRRLDDFRRGERRMWMRLWPRRGRHFVGRGKS